MTESLKMEFLCTPSLFFLFFSAILAITYRFLLKTRLPQNLPPSPPALPIIGHLHLLKKPLFRSLADLSAKYGPILSLRFGSRRVLVVSSPDLVEECFTTHDIAFANRPRLLAGRYLGYNFTTIGWTSYGPHWRNLRRIATQEVLSSARLQDFAGLRRDEVRSLLRQLFEGSDPAGFTQVELSSMVSAVGFDTIVRMVTGRRWYGKGVAGSEESRRFVAVIKESMALQGAVSIGDHIPALRWLDLQGIERRMKDCFKRRDVLFQGLVDEERSKRGGGGDGSNAGDSRDSLIDFLLSLQETEPEYYTDHLIKVVMVVSASPLTPRLSTRTTPTDTDLDPVIQVKQEILNSRMRQIALTFLPNLQVQLREKFRFLMSPGPNPSPIPLTRLKGLALLCSGLTCTRKTGARGSIARLTCRPSKDRVLVLQVMLVAGTDTTAATLEWAMSLLLNNPDVLKKARDELDARVGTERLVEESDLANLTYLHCIVKETLRLYPASPLLLPHELGEDRNVGGYDIAAGTMLFVNAWAIHHDPKLWPQPRRFDPERFSGLEDNGDGFKLIPFGFGRRRCPGSGLAIKVVQFALAGLIQCFEWERAEGQEVDMAEGVGLSLVRAHPLHCLYRPRHSMVKVLSHL